MVGFLALIEDHTDFYTSFTRFDQCFGNGFGGERVGLNEDAAFGLGKRINNGCGAAAAGAEADLNICRARRRKGEHNEQRGEDSFHGLSVTPGLERVKSRKHNTRLETNRVLLIKNGKIE